MFPKPNLLLACGLLAGVVACSKDPEVAKRKHFRTRYVRSPRGSCAGGYPYRNAVNVDPRFGEARLKLAETYISLGELRNALAESVRAADLMPDNVDAQLKTGALLLASGSFADARSRADNVLAIAPSNVDAQILRGNALVGMRHLDGALSQLEQAIGMTRIAPRATLISAHSSK